MTNDDGTPDPVDIHVGRRLRLRRELLRMSQEQVASAIGVTFQQIQKYEQGRNRVSASRLFDICQVLSIPVTYLFQGIDPDSILHQRDGDFPATSLAESRDIFEERAEYLERTETLELVRAFWRIPNPKARAELLELVKLLSVGGEQTA